MKQEFEEYCTYRKLKDGVSPMYIINEILSTIPDPDFYIDVQDDLEVPCTSADVENKLLPFRGV